MTVTIIAKRIQTKLSKQGIRYSLADIRPICEQLIEDIESPTAEEINAVTQHLISHASSLTVIEEEPMESIESAVTSITEVEDIQADTPQTLPEHSAIAVQAKNELITSTAANLGITLNTQEIELIAEKVASSSEDLSDSLEEIKAAILAFVRHKIALNSQKIDETLTEISQAASEGFNQNSQQLTDGLRQINEQIQEQSQDFKSKVKSVLGAFAIPSIKAG